MAKIKIEDLDPNQTDLENVRKPVPSPVLQALEENRRNKIEQLPNAKNFFERGISPNPS